MVITHSSGGHIVLWLGEEGLTSCSLSSQSCTLPRQMVISFHKSSRYKSFCLLDGLDCFHLYGDDILWSRKQNNQAKNELTGAHYLRHKYREKCVRTK